MISRRKLLGGVGLLAAAILPQHLRGWTIQWAYTGPGDVMSGATAFWGLRAYSRSYAGSRGNAMDLRRTNDNATMTATFLTTGALDVATITSWAGGNGIAISKFYDQTGNGNHLTQGTAANQPTLNLSPLNVSLGSSTITISQTSVTPGASTMTLETVANRSSGTGQGAFVRNAGTSGNNYISSRSAIANQWRLVGGSSGFMNITANDATQHSAVGVINGASSVTNLDGSETTGTVTGNTTIGTRGFLGAASTTLLIKEGGVWESTLADSTQRAAVVANAIYWWALYG